MKTFITEKGKVSRTTKEVTTAIIKYFENNEDIFADCIEELDNYNGYLSGDRYYFMDELNELYSNAEPLGLLTHAFYGYDKETYTIDSGGNKKYGEFNPNRKYFTYNGYGNLVSADYKEYSTYLDRYAVEAMSENRRYIDTIENDEELTELFDELEQAEE